MSRTWLRFLLSIALLGVPALVAGPAAGQTISEGDATTEVDASGGARGLAGALGDSLVTVRATLPVGPVAFDPDAPERLALPPGVTVPARTTGAPSGSPAQEEPPTVWRVGDEMPTLRFANLAPGPDHGFANRFDPADLADVPGGKPRGVRVRKIHFIVNGQDEPTGPMEWHVWEDNGGHKADTTHDIVPPFTVTGAPGANVIDLAALGVDVVIDPPRLFQVGVANKASNETSPDVLLDDGAPYVGDSGDFHASVSATAIGANPASMYCGMKEWVMLSVAYGTDREPRSPAWMIWLEVEWLDPPEREVFERVAGPSLAAGDFKTAGRVAWGDYDGDGFEDILASGSTLYRNNGDGTFADVSATAGITDTGGGGLWADYDNDGDLDFYQYTGNCVPCGQPDNFDDLWRNTGDGTFENVRAVDYGGAADAPVPRDPLPTEGAAWADFNNDGFLDLYSANHVDWASGACFPDYLWLNEGPPHYGFRDVSAASGVQAVTRCGRGVNAADFDADGDVDIYVSNYRLNPDLLWLNQGTGNDGVPHFVDVARERGVQGVEKFGDFAGAFGHTIGSVWGDLDRDGDTDMVAANLAHSAWLCFSDKTMVYRSSGGASPTFTDVRADSGVAYVETHSDPSLVDFDNDGLLDLHITHVYDGWRASTYRNTTAAAPGSPIRFTDITHVSGIHPRTGWGTGWADYDRDGDLDLAGSGLWRNRTVGEIANHWLDVVVRGCGLSNRDAIGAKVRVQVPGGHEAGPLDLRQEIVGARGTGSQDSRVVHFGLGSHTGVDQLEVVFPSGQRQVVTGTIGVDRRLEVVEMGAYILPSTWHARVGESVTLLADTCGRLSDSPVDVRWDLDGDGAFDDGEGRTVEWVPTAPADRHVIAVEVRQGGVSGVTRIALDIAPRPAIYVPYAANRAVTTGAEATTGTGADIGPR